MERKYINILHKIGRRGYLDEKNREVLTAIDDGMYIYYTPNWEDKVIYSLRGTNLINVFKGLIIAEQCYDQLGGSTTIGAILYREIERKNLDTNLSIANWAYINTRNGYIPFGSNGRTRAKSNDASEFIRNCEELDLTVKKNRYYRKIEALHQRIEGFHNSIIHHNKRIMELEERFTLSVMRNFDLAQKIINDNTRPVYFYCYEIEKIIIDKSLGKKVLEEILSKFKDMEKRNTKKLKNKIIQEINNR